MSEIFVREFENLDQWRQSSLQQLELTEQWLQSNKLVNDRVNSLLTDMRARLLATQLKVAFVGEYSRGKSELINAIFFASGGRRIMPASVGRTTMCPVEIGYDASLSPCIRLLPLETRLHDHSLTELRYDHPEVWVQEPLNIDNIEQLAAMMAKVSERKYVTPNEATALGLWDEGNPDDNPSVNAVGMVEIPRWRYALVNYPHPLLKRGISILDTPGLNTVGVEPELTLELLPQAHALIFLLAADTGVTRSDLQIWKEYLSGPNTANRPCYVVLNKIDVLWDGILSPEEARKQLTQQRESCASLLNLPLSRILAVSAQKGLLGKIKNDFQLLQDSKLPFVERLLVRDLLPQRQQILRDVLTSGIYNLQLTVNERIANRQKELKEQLGQLKGVSGKNEVILRQISEQIIEKKDALTALRKQSSAMRQVQKRKIWLIQKNISHGVLDKDIAELAVALRDPGMRLNLSKVFNKVIDALHARAVKIEQKVREFETLLIEDMKVLEQAYGIDLTLPPSPGAGTLISDVEVLKTRYENFFGINHAIKMRRGQYAEHMFRTLLTRIRSIFDEMYDMLNMWSNNSYSVLVVQAADKDDAIKRLYDNILRAQSAKEPLSQRIKFIEKQDMQLLKSQSEFEQLIHSFSRVAKGYAPLQNLFSVGDESDEISSPAKDEMHSSNAVANAEDPGSEKEISGQAMQSEELVSSKDSLENKNDVEAGDDKNDVAQEAEELEEKDQTHTDENEQVEDEALSEKIATHPVFDLTLDLSSIESFSDDDTTDEDEDADLLSVMDEDKDDEENDEEDDDEKRELN